MSEQAFHQFLFVQYLQRFDIMLIPGYKLWGVYIALAKTGGVAVPMRLAISEIVVMPFNCASDD